MKIVKLALLFEFFEGPEHLVQFLQFIDFKIDYTAARLEMQRFFHHKRGLLTVVCRGCPLLSRALIFRQFPGVRQNF